jgi:fluoride ion exporter CrcB/FEX
MPRHSSPTIIASTTRFPSFAVNQSITLLLRAGFVGSLSTFASTRKVM